MFAGCVDYLFLPRGHYTRTEDLERYFAGMSLLGQEFFELGVEADAVVPAAFLVGLSDDVTPLEAATAADSLVPGWQEDPAVLADLDTGRHGASHR